MAAGEAPDDEAKVFAAVKGGADNGGADRGTGGENIALLLSRRPVLLPLLLFPLVVADGDD